MTEIISISVCLLALIIKRMQIWINIG